MNRTIVVTSIFLFSLSLFGKGRTELIYGNIYKSIITDLNLPQNSIYVTDTLINLKASAFYFEKIVKKHDDIKDVKYLQWVWYSPKYSKELNYLQQKASCSNAYIVFFSKLIKNMVMAEVYLRNDIRGNVEYEKFVLPSKRYKRPYYAYLFFVSKRGKVKKFYKYEEGYIK